MSTADPMSPFQGSSRRTATLPRALPWATLCRPFRALSGGRRPPQGAALGFPRRPVGARTGLPSGNRARYRAARRISTGRGLLSRRGGSDAEGPDPTAEAEPPGRRILGLVVLPFALWYVGFPLGLKAYYSWLFANAQSITVTDRFGDDGGPSVPAKTITRRDHPDLFAESRPRSTTATPRMRSASAPRAGGSIWSTPGVTSRRLTYATTSWPRDSRSRTRSGSTRWLRTTTRPVPGLVEDFDAVMGAGPGARPAAPTSAIPPRGP